jgi:hypothetical protein
MRTDELNRSENEVLIRRMFGWPMMARRRISFTSPGEYRRAALLPSCLAGFGRDCAGGMTIAAIGEVLG